MANTIYIAPAEKAPIVTELTSSEEILPGKFMIQSAGQFELSGSDQSGIVYIALEDVLGEIDEPYSIGQIIQGAIPSSGEYYQATLADNQTVSLNGPLSTDSSGNLVATSTEDNVICFADEPAITSGSTAGIRVYFSNAKAEVTPAPEVAPSNTVQPTATGSTRPDDEVEADNGDWDGTAPLTYTYQWQLDDVDIPGATAATLLLLLAWVGSTVRCVVTCTNDYGSSFAYSTSITVTI